MTVKLGKREGAALEAFKRGRYDLQVFAEQVLGIALNKAQRRWFRLINPAADGWQWRFKVVIHVAANQIGKTLGTAILILWACNYKMGLALPTDPSEAEMNDWNSKPYTWFHVAPTQQQAYLPLDDINLIVQGAHPAQDVGQMRYGLTCRWLAGLVQEVKVEQYYRGLQFWNGSICQFRTTEDKAKALQGRRAAGITFDEAGLDDHLKAVVNEVLMMRLIAMDGPLFLTGTPNGINDYYEFVQAVTEGTEEQPWKEPTDERPEDRVWIRDSQALCWSIVDDNSDYGLTPEAISMMETGLDQTTKEQMLRGAFLEPAESFFVPAKQILAAFTKKLPELAMPKPNRRYVIFWDPSVASDPTACVVLDVTEKPWRGVALKYHKKPLSFPELISQITATHLLFNANGARAITGFDATSMGGQIVKQSLTKLHPTRALNFGGPSAKVTFLTNLRAALGKGELLLPDAWMLAKREVLNYRLKDDKIAQDIVMALAGAADIASRWGSGGKARPFDVSGRVTQSRWA